MADGLCRIHGTTLNGFGNFVFCNECDAENEQQNIYEEDKDSSEEQLHLDDEKDIEVNFSSIRGGYTIDSDDYGWIIRQKQAPCKQKGLLNLTAGEILYMTQPNFYSVLGAIYRVKLSDVVVRQHTKYLHVVLNDTTVEAEQLLYFKDRVLIGEVDHGPVP